MFTTLLSATERLALFDLLVKMASSDGQVSPAETQILTDAAKALSLGDVDVAAEIARAVALDAAGLRKLAETFASRRSRSIALSELVRIAWVDGHYDANEREAVAVLASWMSVDAAHLEHLEKWTAAGVAWLTEGRDVLGLDQA